MYEHVLYYTQVCTDIWGHDQYMYKMNMVVTDTITKIQLLTRKCKESNFEYVFCNLENKEKRKMRYTEKANNQTGQYQVILSSKTYVSEDKLAKC